jgi:hypothetical protein
MPKTSIKSIDYMKLIRQVDVRDARCARLSRSRSLIIQGIYSERARRCWATRRFAAADAPFDPDCRRAMI